MCVGGTEKSKRLHVCLQLQIKKVQARVTKDKAEPESQFQENSLFFMRKDKEYEDV